MGSQVGENDGEASKTVSMEDLKNLETSLSSTLGNKIKQLHDLVEQLVKDKFASSPPPPPPREEAPSLPKVNASTSPAVVVVGDNHDNTNSSTKKDDGKVEHHEVPNWYSPDPPIPHPH